MTSALRVAVIAFAMAACATATTSGSPERNEESVPRLDGRAFYPVPLDEAPAAVGELHAMLTSLPECPPMREGQVFEEYTRETLKPWIDGMAARLEKVGALADGLRAERPEDRLVLMLAHAHVTEAMVQAVVGLAEPLTRGFDPDVAAATRETLRAQAAGMAGRAKIAFETCAELGPELPAPVAPWAAECERRRAAMAKIAATPEPAGSIRTRVREGR